MLLYGIVAIHGTLTHQATARRSPVHREVQRPHTALEDAPRTDYREHRPQACGVARGEQHPGLGVAHLMTLDAGDRQQFVDDPARGEDRQHRPIERGLPLAHASGDEGPPLGIPYDPSTGFTAVAWVRNHAIVSCWSSVNLTLGLLFRYPRR